MKAWFLQVSRRRGDPDGCFIRCEEYCDPPDDEDCCKCKCFPASASVSLENGQSVTMENLKKGDKVPTGIL